jgi:thiol-disulfide isomerase/thioredoxin
MRSLLICLLCQLTLCAQLSVVQSFHVPKEAGEIQVTHFFKSDTNFFMGADMEAFLLQAETGDHAIPLPGNRYDLIKADSTFTEELDVMKQLQGCAIDLSTNGGRMEANKMLHVLAWLYKQHSKKQGILQEPHDDHAYFEKYTVGWFKLQNRIVVSLDVRLMEGLFIISVNPISGATGDSRFMRFPGMEKQFCDEASNKLVTGVNVGDKIYNIRLPGINGDTVSIAELQNKFVYIDFWASWCVPCREAFPGMIKTYEELKNKKFTSGENGFTILTISLDKDKIKWVEAIKKDGLPWPDHMVEGNLTNGVIQAFNLDYIPKGLLIDGKGIIRRTFLDVQYLKTR